MRNQYEKSITETVPVSKLVLQTQEQKDDFMVMYVAPAQRRSVQYIGWLFDN